MLILSRDHSFSEGLRGGLVVLEGGGGHAKKFALEGESCKTICSEGAAHKITCLQNVRFKDLLNRGKRGLVVFDRGP